MSEEIKYEAVFGNQNLFDGAGTFSGLDVVVRSIASGLKSYARSSDLTPESLRNNPVCAMRRIIRTPTWTVADQKAGRLPEVGCKVATIPNFDCTVVGVDEERKNIAIQYENGKLDVVRVHCVSPIETPEEKAARLRDDWCIKALRFNSEHGSKVEAIYDALLSGDLPVPVKE